MVQQFCEEHVFLIMTVILQTQPQDEPGFSVHEQKALRGKALQSLHDGFGQQVLTNLLR